MVVAGREMTSPREWQTYVEESRLQRGELLRQMLLIVGEMPVETTCEVREDELLQHMLQTVGAVPADVAGKEQRDDLLQRLLQAADLIQRNADRSNKVRSQPSEMEGKG